MRKNPMLNRIMSLGLALALFVSSPASVYAVDASESASAETIVEETSEEAVDTAEGESASNDDTATSRENESDDSKNQDQASDESKSDEKDSKSEEKVNKEETEKTSDEKASEEQTDKNKKEKAEEEKAKEEKELTEKESEEETSYSYKSNGDGTHIKSWTDEDGEAHEETEKCEFDEDGKCKFCEYEKEEEVKEDKTFTVEVDGYKITAVVPADAFDTEVEFFAKTCELTEEEEEAVAEVTITKELGGYTAFDIYFEADGKEVEPESSVKISIESDSVEETNEIVHLKDETTAEVIEADVTDSIAEFEADSFSKYVLTNIPEDQILYQKTSYGALVSDSKYEKNNTNNAKNGLTVYYRNSSKKISDKVYFSSNSIGLTFYAPDNYAIKSIKVGNGKNLVSGSVDEKTITANLSNDTAIYVDFEFKTTKFGSNPDTATVNGATLVKYVTNTSGADNFKFSQGGTGGSTGDGSSSVCNYGQVYQGLANVSIEEGFKLTGNNAKDMFPADYAKNASSYNSYIKKLYSDVSVEFKKDTDGYWTLDSGVYSYKYSNGKIASTGSGDGFFPLDGYSGFDVTHDHVHHFGMEIPINFNVNSNGKVDANASRDDKEAEDTVFRFSGDDDVFVYIDNQLVLDLGGVHSAVQGQINFNTGEILIQGHNGGSGGSSGDSALVSSYDGKVFAHKTNSVDKTLWDLLDTNLETFSQQNHLMTVVYFERGDHDSNCRISYNFNPNTTTTANFEGMKIDSSTKTGLAGAQFKLYTDPECQNAAGTYTATSLDDGTIKFTGLTKGDYYMKEVVAPTNYSKLENAIWKLSVTVKDSRGNLECKLYAQNSEAKQISLGANKEELAKSDSEVKYITNSKNIKTLKLEKIASDGTENQVDKGALYTFKIERAVEKDSKGNVIKKEDAFPKSTTFKAEWTDPNTGKKVEGTVSTYSDDSHGASLINLYSSEVVTISDLPNYEYIVTEVGAFDANGKNIPLTKYDTRILDVKTKTVTVLKTVANDSTEERSANVIFGDDDEKTIRFENLAIVEETSEPQPVPSPHNKQAIKNDDGTYTLKLDFQAPFVRTKTRHTLAKDIPGETTYKDDYAIEAFVVDELSDYVDIVYPTNYEVVVRDSDGQVVNNVKFSSEFSYDSTNRKIEWKVTNKAGLGDYTYEVSLKIKPNVTAYELFKSNGSAYPENMIGDENTGTHSGEAGFFSNNQATVTYKFDDKTLDPQLYPMPVVQIDKTNDWQLVKKSTSGAVLKDAEFTLSKTDGSKVYYGKSDSNGVVTWYEKHSRNDYSNPIMTIPTGSYTLRETAAPAGFAKSEEVWNIKIDYVNGVTAYVNKAGDLNNKTNYSESEDGKATTVIFTFENQVAYTLPKTGGSGVYVYTIGGILLMIAGALLLYKNKNNKNK